MLEVKKNCKIRTFLRLFCCAAVHLILLRLTYSSWKLARADQLANSGLIANLRAAAALEPSNAEYHQRLASFEAENSPDPQAGFGEFQRALALNPQSAANWIELGLHSELEGDSRQAEANLLHAAAIDKTFLPPWSLANYYFRRSDAQNFWTWARRAAELSYGDANPLFQLCWRMSDDARLILERVIPPQKTIERKYVSFLVREDRLDAAGEAAARLMQALDAEDRECILDYCENVLRKAASPPERLASALRFWNSLSEHRLIPYTALAPEKGVSLTNGDFSIPLSETVFDWRIKPVDGVSVSQQGPPPELQIVFSGSQPERCDVLEQFIPVVGRRSYELEFEYRTGGLRTNAGLGWNVVDASSGENLVQIRQLLYSEAWAPQRLTFATLSASYLVRLIFAYQRVPGTTRIEGSIFLRNVKLR